MPINPKIEKLARRFKISPRKLSVMRKAGFLNLESDPRIAAIKRHYATDRGANAVHLIWLLREPKLIEQIGAYEARAKADIEALGDWQDARSALAWLSDQFHGTILGLIFGASNALFLQGLHLCTEIVRLWCAH